MRISPRSMLTALAFAGALAVGPALALTDAECEANWTKLDAAGVKARADLPSLDVLRATLLATLAGPASKLVRTLNEPGASLARVLKAKTEKGEAAA